MPLKDRDRTRPRRLTRLGIIRLGYKEERKRNDGSTYEFPRQADYFVLRDAPEVAEHYGVPAGVLPKNAPGYDKLRELDVILPFPEIERDFDAWYTVWAGGVLVCKGDGQYVQYASAFELKTGKGGKLTVHRGTAETHVSDGIAQAALSWNGEHFQPGDLVPCSGAAQNLYPHCVACRRSGILKVMMADPELFRLGYYQIATGSGRNYDSIMATLEIVSGNGQRPVNGIPFKLRLVEGDTSFVDDDNVRRTTTKWFLELEPEPTFTRALLGYQAQKLAGLLPEVVDEPQEYDGEIIDDSGDAPPPHAEAGEPAEADAVVDAAADLGGEIVEITTMAEFRQAVTGLGITGPEVREALGGKGAGDWCGANDQDLTACLHHVRQATGK